MNAEIVGVSFDKAEASLAFGRKYSFPFPLIPDESRRIGLLYGAADTSEDEFAPRIAYLIGPDGKIVEAHAKVDASTYPASQLESLRRVAGGN
ncbi:MAG: redoxin domain-containing protein [Acidobacteria bacterium]|nr:redoxin domain-containing protein [Acidobacteriota bacterium]